MKEYDRFKKKFSLSSYANDIAVILDEEADVPRYYAELVERKNAEELYQKANEFLNANSHYISNAN